MIEIALFLCQSGRTGKFSTEKIHLFVFELLLLLLLLFEFLSN